MMVSAELGWKHLPASLNSSPCARHMRVSGNVMVCVKLAGWWQPVLLGPEAERTDVVPRWLILIPLHTALCCMGRSSPHFCGREALFSSISHHSSLVGLWEKKKAQASVHVVLPHSVASFPQGAPCLVLPSLLQQPEICLTTIQDRSSTRWRINSFCRRNETWMDLVSWVWVWEDRGWACCSGSVCEVEGWRRSCCREWKTPFWDCSQLPTYKPGNATRFSFAYALEKPWAGPRQVSVTRILSGWGFDARIANRIRTSGYAFFYSSVWAECCASCSRGWLNLPGFIALRLWPLSHASAWNWCQARASKRGIYVGRLSSKNSFGVTGCSNTLVGLWNIKEAVTRSMRICTAKAQSFCCECPNGNFDWNGVEKHKWKLYFYSVYISR